MEAILAIAAVVALIFSQSAPTPERVVLLPDDSGKVGKVLVKTAAGEQSLASAYAGARIAADGKLEARSEDAAEIAQRYGALLATLPPKPQSYLLYFSTGSELTAESKATLAELQAELARRPVPEITVIGHTDRVGTVEANDALSLRRAETVRELLRAQNLGGASIAVAGRGEREPLVPTADEVAEPRNRRVEINVR